MKNKNSLNYLDFVKTPVILSIAMIIAGLVVALKSSEVAWILIGVSVLALGVFQLFSAVSSVREDLRKSKIIKNPFGDKNKFKDSYDIKNKDYIQKNSDDDGFKEINRKNVSDKAPQADTENVFEDGDEYVRIKGKIKKSVPEKENIKTEQTVSKENKTEKDNIIIKDNKDNNVKKENKTENNFEKTIQSDIKSETEKKLISNDDSSKIEKKVISNDDSTKTEKKENIEKQDIMESKEQKIEYASIESIQELVKNEDFKNSNPKSELEYMLSKLLLILSSITDTKTAVFAIANHAENQFSIESFVTTIPKKNIKANTV
jgi:hypothetical protein